ncbi:uncharacterized protein LOC120800234 isoform X2 [Xiphias gladius]|nr:uncharacterized protein LOC120800234 isoform X2 [Xiphias gladius]
MTEVVHRVHKRHSNSLRDHVTGQKRPFQASERHNNGLVDVVVHRFLYAHPPDASVPRSISEHCYQSLILGHITHTTNFWYKRLDLLRRTRSAAEASRLLDFVVNVSHLIFTDMSGEVVVVFALMAALVVSGAASSPESSAAGEGKETNTLHRLLAKREKVRDLALRQGLAPQTRSGRMERRAHLSEDEREIMTKQVMQAISEMMNSECTSDRDYQGWVDFGRRDAE